MSYEDYIQEIMAIFGKKCGTSIIRKLVDSTKGQIPVLLELRDAEREGREINAGDLANFFLISTARVATILNKLEEAELVERKKSEADGRITVLKLTHLGYEKIQEHERQADKFAAQIISNIEEDDMRVFVDVLKKIVNNAYEFIESKE